MIDPLSAWLHIARESADLSQPCGRPLYAYRISEADFESLERLLREVLSSLETLDSLGSISMRFPGLFVLYAAEWWRRRYDGSGWTWQTILDDLGAADKPWSSLHRGQCVERGLRHWKLDSTTAGGLRYLRAIALQGGLPLQLLASARGSLGRVLRRVLALARVGTPGSALIRGWVESLQHELPQSYRQEAIYDLLTDVIDSVLALKHSAQITQGTDAITRLDEHCPGWRERFPLPIDDAQAQGLIDQLVQEAAAGPPPERLELRLERWLEPLEQGDWTLCGTLITPEQMTTEAIRSQFEIAPSEPLPRTFEIRLEAGDEGLGWVVRRLAGQGAYRVERQARVIAGEAVSRDLRLRLIAPDARTWRARARRSEELNPGLPWLFEADVHGTPQWVRQGGGGIPGASALVAIPAGWRVQGEDGASVVPLGRIKAPPRMLYPVRGKATVTATDGLTWRLRTGQAHVRETDFHWVGERFWDGFIEPSLAFRGRPRLYDGAHAIPDSTLNWHPNPTAAPFGPRGADCVLHGEQVHGARLVLLPTGARIKLKPHADGGEIRLEGWQAAGASVSGPGVAADVVKEPDRLILRLTWHNPDADDTQSPEAAAALPPEWVEVAVTWPRTPGVARLRLPFPARGVHAFDDHDRVLAPNAWLPAHRLAGVRLVAVGVGNQLSLWLQLRHTHQEGAPAHACIPLQVAPGQSRVEVRLQDYATDIDRLFAADELLDAWIEVSLRAGPQDLFKLRISRYFCPLVRLDPDVGLAQRGLARIDPGVLAELPVQALRLEVPAEESVRLEPHYAEGVAIGVWAFAAPTREPGSWLIYPGPTASERFRPTLWTIAGDNPAASPLTRALAVPDREERTAALDAVVARLAEDYAEPGWSELERLAGHLGHLPLASFDLWRRLVHSPDAMAALALRRHPDLSAAFVARFAHELPFTWELIPFSVWRLGTLRLQRQCIGWFGNIHWRGELKLRLEKVQQTLSAEHPALRMLLGVLLCVALEEESADLKATRHPACDSLFRERLFGGGGTTLNALLTGHLDDAWPAVDTLLRWINTHRKSGKPGTALFCRDFPDYRDGVINLPILLAIQVATNQTDAWRGHATHIHSLRCYRAFDPDWFDTAFDLTIARCLSTGLLEID